MPIKVSVIVPVYNVEKYLSECIESIISQTLIDWELILVNDGSPDNCEQICLDYAKLDSRIKYIYQDNRGVSSARNKGLSYSKGEFIFFMDSDDTIDKFFLEKAYFKAKSDKSDIVVLGAWFFERMPHPTALPIMALFIKHSFINKYPDILFPIGIQPCEDGLFSHQLLALTDKISFQGDIKYFYRQHDNQNHHQINTDCEKILTQIPIWFNILIVFYTKYNLWESHALHLAKFIEHEPFELRYKSMPFTKKQKIKLFNLIHDFYTKYVANNLTSKAFDMLTPEFKNFIVYKDMKKYELHVKIQNIYNRLLSLFRTRSNNKKLLK